MIRPPLVALLVAAGPLAAQDAPPDLDGLWVSPGIEAVAAPGGASAYARRSVAFADGIETLTFEVFADPEGARPLFTYRSSGPFAVVGPSATVPGAWEVDLTNDASTVTMFVDDAALRDSVNLGACDFTLGEPLEIGGCASGQPFISSAPGCVDKDLVHVEAGVLRFGDPATDRCVERPTSLDALTYRRVG